MSRAHVFGFDTNAAQFDRMGNPWVTERERAEFSATPREIKQNRRKVGKFPKSWENTPRPNYSRVDSPAFCEAARSRLFVKLFKSGLPGGTRTVVGVNPAPREMLIRPARDTELTADQRALRDKQRAEVQARLEAGEVAYAASEAAKTAEKRHLSSIIKAAERRLAKLG